MTMRCWVALPVLVATGVTFQEAVAQGAAAPVSAGLEARVRALVAERWSVLPDDLELEWSGRGPAALGPDSTGVELLGSGTGGHWIVRLTRPGGGTESVRVQAGLRIEVPVAARELQRGDVLATADIAFDERVRWGPLRGVGDADVSEGWVTHRAIRAGEELRVPAVRPPLAVVSGEAVELVWSRHGVGLRVLGKAVQSATVGDTVFVRTEGGQRLRGVVVGPGRVNVTQGGEA